MVQKRFRKVNVAIEDVFQCLFPRDDDVGVGSYLVINRATKDESAVAAPTLYKVTIVRSLGVACNFIHRHIIRNSISFIL